MKNTFILTSQFYFCVLLATQTIAFPQFTREESQEDTDDVYDEEEELANAIKIFLAENGNSGKKKQVIPPAGGDKKLSAASHQFTRQESNPANNSQAISSFSASFPDIQASIVASGTGSSPANLVITVPHGAGGIGHSTGQTITINIPIPKAVVKPQKNQTESSSSAAAETPADLASLDELEVKKIESAIMEALIFANEMKTLNISAGNDTGTFELDFEEFLQKPENESSTGTSSSSSSSSTSDKPPRRRRPTTSAPASPPQFIGGPDSADPLGLRPLTALIMSQVQNGKLPEFLMRAAWAFVRDGYALSAIQTLECIVIDYCVDSPI